MLVGYNHLLFVNSRAVSQPSPGVKSYCLNTPRFSKMLRNNLKLSDTDDAGSLARQLRGIESKTAELVLYPLVTPRHLKQM